MWGDGDPLTWSLWQTGQPNNFWSREHRASQDCVELEPGYDLQWNDEICSFENAYVCQERLMVEEINDTQGNQFLSTRFSMIIQ